MPKFSTEYSRVNGSSAVSTETAHHARARFGWSAKIEKKISVSTRFISGSDVRYTMLSAKYGIELSSWSFCRIGRQSAGCMWRRCARSRFVPSFHVYMTSRIANVSSMVNQPPRRNLASDAKKNMNWMARNSTVNAMAPTRLPSCQI